ncbi:MAG: tRNA epoxyqueuosine(34) reductase QueG [Acidimicrobiales bacterium]
MPVAPLDVDVLRAVGLAAGLDAVGVARAESFVSTRADLEQRAAEGLAADMAFTYRNPERSTSPQHLLRNARSLVVGARSYHRAETEPPVSSAGANVLVGEVARYAREDHYAQLRRGLEALAQRLRQDGFRAALQIDSNHLVDREAAYRAGLGWYGKNTNLLLPGRGSWFVLGSVITDADLPADQPVADGCGGCRRCLDACPTAALPRPGVLDANRCLAWLAQRPGLFPRPFREALGARIYGCDDCQTACPPNRQQPVRSEPVPLDRADRADHAGRVNTRATRVTLAASSNAGSDPPRQPGAWVELFELLDGSDDALLDAYGAWYLADRQPFALRRNALLALGNVADGSDPAVVSRVAVYLHHDDPNLRATAVWAARRLGLDALAATAAADPDPTVRDELTGAVNRR